MDRIYHYVGPSELRGSLSDRRCVRQPQDIKDWIVQTGQTPDRGAIVATFIIDTDGQLWIADRCSEHVACADGQPVLSAGEMTFSVEGDSISVTDASNQSLGYCPEEASWPAVAAALEKCGLPAPVFFTNAYIIRLCERCGTKNIVKDNAFECGVCQTLLPSEWNFAGHGQAC